jgi:hypothetical protein
MAKNQELILNKSFRQLISDGFKIFSKNFRKLLFVWVVFTILVIIAETLLLTHIRFLYYSETINPIIYLIITYIISGIIGIIPVLKACSVSSFLFRNYSRGDDDFPANFKSAFNKRLKYPIFIYAFVFYIIRIIFDMIQDKYVKYLFLKGVGVLPTMFLQMILVYFFFFLFLIIEPFYIFIIFTYNIKDIEKPIYEARSLTKGIYRKIIVVLLIEVVLSFIFIFINMFLYNLIAFLNEDFFFALTAARGTLNYIYIFLNEIILAIHAILFGSLKVCLVTPLFAHQYLSRAHLSTKEIKFKE